MHEITAGHRSLSGTISRVTDRFSNFDSISYTEDRQELRGSGTKGRQLHKMSGTGEIFISGAGYIRQCGVRSGMTNLLNLTL